MNTVREVMEYDVVIVGAGPSGLSAAIRLKQLANEGGHELSVCVIEKGSEVGAHLLSGAVLETRALDELIPDWRDRETWLCGPTPMLDAFETHYEAAGHSELLHVDGITVLGPLPPAIQIVTVFSADFSPTPDTTSV